MGLRIPHLGREAVSEILGEPTCSFWSRKKRENERVGPLEIRKSLFMLFNSDFSLGFPSEIRTLT